VKTGIANPINPINPINPRIAKATPPTIKPLVEALITKSSINHCEGIYGDDTVAKFVSGSCNAQHADQPQYKKNNQYGTEHATKSGATVPAMGVISTATAKQKQ
jgi:hypothetical protein